VRLGEAGLGKMVWGETVDNYAKWDYMQNDIRRKGPYNRTRQYGWHGQ